MAAQSPKFERAVERCLQEIARVASFQLLLVHGREDLVEFPSTDQKPAISHNQKEQPMAIPKFVSPLKTVKVCYFRLASPP